MSSLKTSDPLALHLLMTEDLYLAAGDEAVGTVQPAETIPVAVASPAQEAIKPVPPVKAEPAFFDYLGENNKYTLILVNEPAYAVIGPKELETLTNILKGKKQETKDVAVVNLHKYPSANFDALKGFFACNSMVFFGINPTLLGIEGVQANQIVNHQGTKVLATYSITEMLSSADKKRVFWNEMKTL